MAWDPGVPAPTVRVLYQHRRANIVWERNLLNLLMDQTTTSTPAVTLPVDSYATIDMSEPESTQVKHAVISGPTSVGTCWEIWLSDFCENMTTPSTQLRMDSELDSLETVAGSAL